MAKRKYQIKAKNKYKFIIQTEIIIDSDIAGRDFPKFRSLENIAAEKLGAPEIFKIEGKKIGSIYRIRAYGPRKQKKDEYEKDG